MEKIRLKGGSLSGTYLVSTDSSKYVRKEVSLEDNREYGFQRWYSQLKKLQRYQLQYPGLFPEVLGYGIINDKAFFDLEYIENSKPGNLYVLESECEKDVENYFDRMIVSMSRLHKDKLKSSGNPMKLYLHEEVDRRLADCMNNESFRKFCKFKTVVFNGNEVPALTAQLDLYKRVATQFYKLKYESFTHGNLTLENTLFDGRKVIFLDPYEENIIDSELAEISQILQSSNSRYEEHNGKVPKVIDNNILSELEFNKGVNHFNQLVQEHIRKTYNYEDQVTIRVLEVSQFIRMLPFKMVVDEEKMKLFYALASYQLNNLICDLG